MFNFYNKAVSLEICLIRLWNFIALLKTKNEKRNEGVTWHFKSKDNKPSCTAKKKNPFFIGTWSKLPIKNVHLTKNNYFYLDIRTFVECILNVGVFCLTAQVEFLFQVKKAKMINHAFKIKSMKTCLILLKKQHFKIFIYKCIYIFFTLENKLKKDRQWKYFTFL